MLFAQIAGRSFPLTLKMICKITSGRVKGVFVLIKRILKIVGLTSAIVAAVVVCYVLYVIVSYNRIQDMQDLGKRAGIRHEGGGGGEGLPADQRGDEAGRDAGGKAEDHGEHDAGGDLPAAGTQEGDQQDGRDGQEHFAEIDGVIE